MTSSSTACAVLSGWTELANSDGKPRVSTPWARYAQTTWSVASNAFASWIASPTATEAVSEPSVPTTIGPSMGETVAIRSRDQRQRQTRLPDVIGDDDRETVPRARPHEPVPRDERIGRVEE